MISSAETWAHYSFTKDVSICLMVFFYTTYAISLHQNLGRRSKTLSFQVSTFSLSVVFPFLQNHQFLLIFKIALSPFVVLSLTSVFWLYMLPLQFPYFSYPMSEFTEDFYSINLLPLSLSITSYVFIFILYNLDSIMHHDNNYHASIFLFCFVFIFLSSSNTHLEKL